MDKALPNELEAEDFILSSIIYAGDIIQKVWDLIAGLEPVDFYNYKNRELFSTLLDMKGRGDFIDPLSLLNKGIISQQRLVGLDKPELEGVSIHRLPHYVAFLKKATVRRNMILIGDKMKQRALDPLWEVDSTNINKIAETFKLKCTPPSLNTSENNPFSGLEEYAEAMRKQGNTRLGTGILKVDQYLDGGVLPGQSFNIVGAEGSMKTSLALNALTKFIKETGLKAIYFCMDTSMSRDAIRNRLLQMFLKVRGSELIDMVIADSPDVKKANDRLNQIYGGKLLVIEGGQTLDSIESIVERERPGAAVFDYFTALGGFTSDLDNADRGMEGLNNLAKKYKYANMILHQMSRNAKLEQAKGLFGHHAKGGGKIEEGAETEIEIAMYEPDIGEDHLRNARMFAIVKNRAGERPVLLVQTEAYCMRFLNDVEEMNHNGKRKNTWKVGSYEF